MGIQYVEADSESDSEGGRFGYRVVDFDLTLNNENSLNLAPLPW
jgi:hypothetical protein